MRLFQNSGIYRSYRPRLQHLLRNKSTFAESMAAFFDDRYGIAHVLQPVLTGDSSAFFANGDDPETQRLWAVEQGMKAGTALDVILLSQIEHHRTEVFYNSDPMRYGDAFLKRLPGSVRRTVAWRAAPSHGGEFLSHDIIVNNFPALLDSYRDQGARAEYLAPAHDTVMDAYAARTDRPIDVLFVGTYSRYHRTRALALEAVAALRHEMRVAFHLDRSRLTRLAETPLGWLPPLARHRRSRNIRAVTYEPVFGRDLLDAMGNARIIVNGAIDMAGEDRGNMRVWEALGCGATLVSDAGCYPDDMIPGKHFITYRSVEELIAHLRALHADVAQCQRLAEAGHEMIADRFSKARQWARFEEIVA
ncbi:glycosyltransferase [Sphingomonas sp. MMSM20]|uniref:glycosyltransferase family protein n=1 Tax=Sphingomonas lycopersici TaxID=2951807 RepID=UPI002238AC7B|nr:glycosyltransferase [Sphingomonas lycopersici]MCW6531213.1 glycosyltransferase [Sphingomonas lycopersici]